MGGDDQASTGTGTPGDGAAADPVRDLLLGLANQIDQLAALFGPETGDAFGEVFGEVFGAAFSSSGPVGRVLAGASGEITGLLTEIGDLLARLLTAVIAVLEAIAEALRSAPTETSAPRHYEPIPVRINVSGPNPSGETHG